MIIVSQDKDEIVNFDNIGKIYIDYSNGNYEVSCTDIKGCYLTRLGEYKTEERAKEVLQEIIEFYEILKRHECSSNNGRTLFIKETFVYEMPLE